MRLSDIADYFALRGRLANAWQFVRLRSRPPPGPFFDVRFRDGSSVRLRSVAMDRHTFHRIFARDEYRLDGLAPRSLGTVIDVGAHIGLFAVRVAPLAERVLSFEPIDGNFEMLKRNVASLPHVTPLKRAVAPCRGRTTIFLSPDNPSAHSMFPATAERRTGAIEVEAVALADIFAEHGIERCGLLKLDCEGAEYEILYSLPAELWPRIDRLCMEYHAVNGAPVNWTGAHLAKHLEQAGHDVELRPSRKDPAKGHLFSRCRETRRGR